MTDRRIVRKFAQSLLIGVLLCVIKPNTATAAVTISNGSNLGTYSIGTQQLSLFATGGTAPYMWALTNGTLPPGLSIRTDMPSWFSPQASAGLIGVSTTPGTYGFTLTVTDNIGASASQAFTLTITALTILDLYQLPDAFAGNSYSYTLNAGGLPGSVTWAVSNCCGSLPGGLTLDGVTGIIGGTPTTPGQFNFNITATQGSITVGHSFQILVSALSFTTPGLLPNATANSAYTGNLVVSGGTAPYSFAVTSANLPPSLSLSSTGIFSGTPTNSPGTYRFGVTASDSAAHSYTKQFVITLNGSPETEPFLSIDWGGQQLDDATLGIPRSYAARVFGGTAPYSFTISGLPQGMTFRTAPVISSYGNYLAPTDSEMWGVPLATGDYTVSVSVTDSSSPPVTVTRTVALKVVALDNDFPPSAKFNSAFSWTLRIIGGAGPYQWLQKTGTLPAGLTFNAATGVVSGTPAETGSTYGQFRMSDSGGLSLTRHIFFTIDSSPSTVFINANSTSFLPEAALNQFYNFGLSGGGAATITWSVNAGSTLPPGLTLTLGGVLSGTPTTAGVYTFSIRATDGSNSSNFAIRQFRLNVTPVAINFNGTLPFANVATLYTFPLIATGGTGPYTWALAPDQALPPGILLSGNVLTGTPSSPGFFFFSLIVTDSGGSSRIAYLNLPVYPAGILPPITIQTDSGPNVYKIGDLSQELTATGGNGTYTWTLTNGTLPPGLSIRTDTPPWFSSQASAGLIGVATTPGTYVFTLTVTSGNRVASRTFTFIISGNVPADWWSLPDAFVDVGYTYTLHSATAVPVTWSVWPNTTLPTGLTLTSAGVLSGTPAQAGTYTISFGMNDGTYTVFRTSQLLVSQIQVTNNGTLPNATQGTSYASQTFTATGGTGPYSFFVSGSLPNGLTLSTGGVLSGAPTDPGTFNFGVTATDAAQRSYNKQFSLDVIGIPPILPRITTSAQIDNCTIGNPCTRSFFISGGTGPYTWEIEGGPPGMSLSSGNAISSFVAPSSGQFVGVPTAPGTFTLAITATDSASPAQNVRNSYQLRVVNLDATGIRGCTDCDPFGATRGIPYTAEIQALGGTGSYNWQIIGGFLPAGLSLNPNTGAITGTPIENGFFRPLLQITDGASNTLVRGRNVNVGATNTTIVVNSQNLGSATVNGSFSRQLSASGAITFVWTLPSGSILPPGLTLSSSGLLSGSPTTSGNYSFLVQTADSTNGANFGVKQLYLTVSPIFVPITTTLTFANLNTFYSQSLTASGGTPPYSFAVAADSVLPPGLFLSTAGVLSGTPGSTGQYSFNITITDSSNPANSRTLNFNVSIYPTGTYPPLFTNVSQSITVRLGRSETQLIGFGGKPPYTFSYTPGATPIPGMRVQNGAPLPASFPSSTTAGLIGIANTVGTFNTSIRITDSLGTTFDRPITFKILPLATTSQTTLPRAVLSAPYSFTFGATGGTSPYLFSATASSLPPGLTLTSAGVLSGTPTAAGSFSFSLTLTDSASNSTSQTYTLPVDPFNIDTGGLLPTAIQNATYTATLLASRGTGPYSWAVTGGTLPPGLTLDGATGVISGTPTVVTFRSFTVVATDSTGKVASKQFTIQAIAATPQPLIITTTSPLVSDDVLGDLYNFGLSASGGVPPYTWSVEPPSTLPSGFALTPCEQVANLGIPGLACVNGRGLVPNTFNFTLRVTDSAGNFATGTFALRVATVSVEYTSLPLSGTSLVSGTPYTQTMLGEGGTGNYSWTALGTMPPGLSLSTDGYISGTSSDTGTFNVPIQITDGNGAAGARNVRFTIGSGTPVTLAINDGPDLGTVSQGFVFSRTLNPSGSPLATPNYTFSVNPGSTLPPGFQLVSGDAILSGTSAGSTALYGVPPTTGTFTFTLRLQDASGNVGIRTMTLRVSADTIFTGTLANASVGVPYSTTLIAWGASQTFSIPVGSALPSGLTLTPGGLLSGTPVAAGDYSFNVAITDAQGFVATRNLSLHISTIAITDSNVLPNATTNSSFTHSFTATGGNPAKTWSLASGSSLPAGLTLSSAGVLAGVPSVSGRFSFTVVVTDGSSQVTKLMTLFVRDPYPAVLSATLASTALADATVGQSYSTTLNMSGGLPPYTWTVASGSALPSGMTLLLGSNLPANFSPGTIILAGAPTAVGLYTFTLDLADSAGVHVQRTFTLNVSPVDINSNALRNPTLNSPYVQIISAFGGTAPYTFTLASGPLPTGLSLSSGGTLSGTSKDTGSFTFSVKVTDSAGVTFTRFFTLTVASTGSKTINISFSSTPSDLSLGVATTGTLLATYTDGSAIGPLTWTFEPSSNAPPGLRIVTGAAAPVGFDPTFVYLSGRPAATGTYVYTLRATDTFGNFGLRTITQDVSPIQRIGSNLLPPARSGQPYNFNFEFAGGTRPYTFSLAAGSLLPPGISISPTGLLSGNTTLTGGFNFGVTVRDASSASLTSNVTLTVLRPAENLPLLLPPVVVTADLSRGSNRLIPLNNLISGGVPPFTWSLASGTLPIGMSISSPNAVGGQYLIGAPTVPGTYNYTLTVTDSVGQTGPVPVITTISPIVANGLPLPLASPGTPYSATITPSGGSSPYTMELAINSSLPAGLSFNNGVFSGTPAAPGRFTGRLIVKDSAGNVLSTNYALSLGSPTAPASLVNIDPAIIRITYVQGDPSPVPAQINITDAGTPLTVNAAVSGLAGASLSMTSGTTPLSAQLLFDRNMLSNLQVGTYYGVVAASSPQTPSVAVLQSASVVLNVVQPPPCSYTVNPAGATFGVRGGGGSFDVTAGSNCNWAASASDTWVTFSSATAGTGNGTVSYAVGPNTTTSQRTATVTVTGQSNNQTVTQTYTITEFGSTCSFSINPLGASVGPSGGVGTVSVTASVYFCHWTAISNSSFLKITNGFNGTGNGTVTFTVDPNPSALSQSGTLTIAGQTFTVNQTGVACTVSLGSMSATFSPSGGPGSVAVNVASGCNYSTLTGPNWITVGSGGTGTGSGTLNFSVSPNSSTQTRSGFLVIGGQSFEVDQDGVPCSFTVSATNNPIFPSGGGSGSLTVSSNGSSCEWNALSNNSFVTINSAATNTGPGTVNFTVAPNNPAPPSTSAAQRNTTLTVASQTVTVNQAGTVCGYSLRSTDAAMPATGGSGSVGVLTTSACAWTASSNDSWLLITSSGNQGTSDVAFTAFPNTSANLRTGSLTIAGITYAVNQPGAACSYSLSSDSTTFSSSGGSGSLSFSTTTDGCTPIVMSFSGWINVNSTFSGTSGTVTYTVPQNAIASTRTGLIQVGDKTYTITQTAAACGFSLNAYGASFNKTGGSGSILTSASATACTPVFSVIGGVPEVTLDGPFTFANSIFTQQYTVAPYQTFINWIRTMQIDVSGTKFTIKQTSW